MVVTYPFSDLTGVKKRPGVILLDSQQKDVLIARITSRSPKTPFDVEIEKWQQVGLNVPSTILVNKIMTLDRGLIDKRLGNFMESDWKKVIKALKKFWKPTLKPKKP